MSKEEPKDIEVANPSEIMTDMSLQEEKELNKFIQADMPGLNSVSDDKIAESFSMYMKGKSYTELTRSLKIKKPVLLFISQRDKWYEKKTEYLEAIQSNITDKLLQTKVESANFLTDVIGAYHKIMEDKIAEALAKGLKPTEFMDPKELSTYFRAIDTLEKIIPRAGQDSERKSIFNLNIQGNAEVEASEDGKTVKVKSISEGSNKEVLAALAKLEKYGKKK